MEKEVSSFLILLDIDIYRYRDRGRDIIVDID
jgi:hypothetical protein